MALSAQQLDICTQDWLEPVVAKVSATLAETLEKQLEAAITAGDLAPGSRLDEQDIARRYGMSRTPVREAFRALAAANLVELRGRQGAVVRSMDVRTLIEMFQVMAELEGLCARLAARRLTPDMAERLQAIHVRVTAVAQTGDADAFYDANQDFHEAIYEAGRNAFLATETRQLRNRVAAYRRRVTHMPNRITDTLREHQDILDAIVAHDGERSHRVMRDHVNLLGDTLVDFVAAFR